MPHLEQNHALLSIAGNEWVQNQKNTTTCPFRGEACPISSQKAPHTHLLDICEKVAVSTVIQVELIIDQEDKITFMSHNGILEH